MLVVETTTKQIQIRVIAGIPKQFSPTWTLTRSVFYWNFCMVVGHVQKIDDHLSKRKQSDRFRVGCLLFFTIV